MDSERFDGLVRSLGQIRSRRQTLRGLAGAGAFLALLAAKPVAAGKAGRPNNPGNSQPGSGQNGQPGGSQLGGSQPGPLGSGQNGSIGPSPDCDDQCRQQVEQCRVRCTDSTCRAACDSLEDQMDQCVERCEFG